MKKSVATWQWWGFAVTSLLGTLLHYLYEWMGKTPWVAPFSGVNESTWEHMKLLFWPMLLFAILQSFFFKGNEAFWCIKLRGVLGGIILIPVLFYAYNGVVGKSPYWINIAIFFVSAAISYIYEAKLARKENLDCKSPKLAIAILCLIALLFVVFTFFTPKLALFKDPINSTYGI